LYLVVRLALLDLAVMVAALAVAVVTNAILAVAMDVVLVDAILVVTDAILVVQDVLLHAETDADADVDAILAVVKNVVGGSSGKTKIVAIDVTNAAIVATN
jgi:hypothetical protein